MITKHNVLFLCVKRLRNPCKTCRSSEPEWEGVQTAKAMHHFHLPRRHDETRSAILRSTEQYSKSTINKIVIGVEIRSVVRTAYCRDEFQRTVLYAKSVFGESKKSCRSVDLALARASVGSDLF